MPKQSYLAIDLGAESGRGVVAEYDGSRIEIVELRRFPTGRGDDDVCSDGVRRWDFERLCLEVEQTVQLAISKYPELCGVGVDSWGVDFGLLGSDNKLLEPPIHYRDSTHAVAMQEVLLKIPAEKLWDRTGIQLMPFNTLFQLHARHKRNPNLLTKASKLLMIPDLLHHRLTGGAASSVERTNASTTQLPESPHTGMGHKSALGARYTEALSRILSECR